MNKSEILSSYQQMIADFCFSDLNEKLETLYQETLEQAMASGKENVVYAYLSCMRIDWEEYRFIFRLDLYDENWFLDPIECFSELDLSEEIKSLSKAHCTITANCRQFGLDLMDMQCIWRGLFVDCFNKVRSDMEYCIFNFARKRNQKSIQFYLGEYYDQSTLVYGEGK